MKAKFLIIFGFLSILFTIKDAFAHGVHCGISCPVGGRGMNDAWHMADYASSTMFNISLVTYVGILILFSYFSYQRRIILRKKNEN